jgi:SAM-dependent methyltransferase
VRLNDPADVALQYATESNLQARRSLYGNAVGADPRELAFAAVAEVAPDRVLEVGGGPGELAARIAAETGAAVVMLDTSARMVELARGIRVDARFGDVQELPFEDATFDCALAAWMLYHVPDLDRGLAELERVLRPGGRLVAVTNALDHLAELRELAGSRAWPRVFTRENGQAILERHFQRVERRDVDGSLTVEDESLVRGYVTSLGEDDPGELPSFELPLAVRTASSIFVAEKDP